jgi:hypothetical protein
LTLVRYNPQSAKIVSNDFSAFVERKNCVLLSNNYSTLSSTEASTDICLSNIHLGVKKSIPSTFRDSVVTEEFLPNFIQNLLPSRKKL